MDMTPEQRVEFDQMMADWKRGYDLSWSDMRRRLAEAEERLAAAEFVAEHWRAALVEWDSSGRAHPLCCVLAALDGETDPAELGLTEDVHDDFRAALR